MLSILKSVNTKGSISKIKKSSYIFEATIKASLLVIDCGSETHRNSFNDSSASEITIGT
jgi:hypothetical protein